MQLKHIMLLFAVLLCLCESLLLRNLMFCLNFNQLTENSYETIIFSNYIEFKNHKLLNPPKFLRSKEKSGRFSHWKGGQLVGWLTTTQLHHSHSYFYVISHRCRRASWQEIAFYSLQTAFSKQINLNSFDTCLSPLNLCLSDRSKSTSIFKLLRRVLYSFRTKTNQVWNATLSLLPCWSH